MTFFRIELVILSIHGIRWHLRACIDILKHKQLFPKQSGPHQVGPLKPFRCHQVTPCGAHSEKTRIQLFCWPQCHGEPTTQMILSPGTMLRFDEGLCQGLNPAPCAFTGGDRPLPVCNHLFGSDTCFWAPFSQARSSSSSIFQPDSRCGGAQGAGGRLRPYNGLTERVPHNSATHPQGSHTTAQAPEYSQGCSTHLLVLKSKKRERNESVGSM